jgi:fructokinase
VVTLDAARVPRYTFHVDGTVDWGWRDDDLPAVGPRTRFVHVGSLASWMPPGDGAIDRRFTALRAGGGTILTYDPNVRPPLLPDVDEARVKVERFVVNAHIVKVSDEDLGWTYPGAQPESIAHRWLRSGPDLVVVTHGGLGSTAFVRDLEPVRRPAYPTSVVDTVGAGDAFMTGLLDSLARRGISSPKRLPPLTRDLAALSGLLDDAALIAGLTCSRRGGGPPWRTEVELRRAQRSDGLTPQGLQR